MKKCLYKKLPPYSINPCGIVITSFLPIFILRQLQYTCHHILFVGLNKYCPSQMSAKFKTILTKRSQMVYEVFGFYVQCTTVQVMRWCFLENFLCLSVPAVAKVTLGQGHALLFYCILSYDGNREDKILGSYNSWLFSIT